MAQLEMLHTPALTILGLLLAVIFVVWFIPRLAAEVFETAATSIRFVIWPQVRKLKAGYREFVSAIRDLFRDDDEAPPD
jgi:hypothetical protein